MPKIPLHKTLYSIYISNLLLAFHYYLIIYINSSFLERIFGKSGLAILYIIGSIINLVIFFNAPRIIRRIGNYRFILWSIGLEAVAIAGLILSTEVWSTAFAFILHQAVTAMIFFSLDIFLEGAIPDEKHTGTIRGLHLTLSNMALVVCPLIVGIVLTDSQFWKVYVLSLLFLIPLFFLIKARFRNAKYSFIQDVNVFNTFLKFEKETQVRGVLFAHFLLQFFYAWMVIYMPIYLHEYIGFSWQSIGVIFTIMLLPFMLFELPVGTLADSKYGEKEIMILGFIIMAVSTFCIPLLTAKNIFYWALLLFTTRVGASFVEITSESYFFKHVNDKNAGLISLFRMTRPLSYVLAPLVVTAVLYLFNQEKTPYGYIFSLLAVLVLIGIHFALSLKDTR